MSFDLKKLMPWNWFKKEEEAQVGAAKLPVERVGAFLPAGSDPFLQMQQEMHRLLDEMWRNWGWPTSVAAASLPTLLKPRLDIEERENAYHITLELPGVEEKDISSRWKRTFCGSRRKNGTKCTSARGGSTASNAATVPFSAPSTCRQTPTKSGSKPVSRMGCLPSPSRKKRGAAVRGESFRFSEQGGWPGGALSVIMNYN